jgi:predicted PurR-regulated permease PerM
MTQPTDDNALTYRGARRLLGLIVLLIIGWSILQSLRSVLLLFAIVFLIAMVLNPILVWLEARRIPRFAGVILLMIGLLALTAILAAFAIPPIMSQLEGLVRRAPDLWRTIRTRLDLLAQSYPAVAAALPQADEIAGAIGRQAGAVANVLVRSTIGLVGGVFSLLFGALLLIFVLAHPQPLVAGYLALAPDRYRERAHRTLTRLMLQMTAWARGVLINGVITGVSTGTGLWLVGVQPALVFGALAFLGEFLPNIGPVLVALPILFVALSLGATKFWLAFGVILFVQQVETNLLVPLVLGKEMRLNPVSILFFTLAMGYLFGLPGAILAVPAAALVQILIDEFYLRPRKLDYTELDREASAVVRGKEKR